MLGNQSIPGGDMQPSAIEELDPAVAGQVQPVRPARLPAGPETVR
jgi:hypothetical protein